MVTNEEIRPTADFFRNVIDELENSGYATNFTKEYTEKLSQLFDNLTYISSEEKEISVAFIYGSVERAVGKRQEKNTLTLPIVSFSFHSLTESKDRQKYDPLINFETSFDKAKQEYKRVISKVPKPIKLNYKINLYSKFIEDLNQLTEKIEAKFNPSLEVSVSFNKKGKAFITDRQEATSVILGDKQDRVLKRSLVITIETYIPSERFLVTNTKKSKFKTELYVNDVLDEPLGSLAPVTEDLGLVITYSDGYKAYVDVRYPSKPSKTIQLDGSIPVAFLVHGAGDDRSSQAAKAFLISLEEEVMTVTFDIRGQGASLDVLNDNTKYGRTTQLSFREQMDIYEIMRFVIDKYSGKTSAIAANPNKIAWLGFSQGGSYSLMANGLSETAVPEEVIENFKWKDIVTKTTYTSSDKFPKISFTAMGGVPPSLNRLAVNYGYIFPHTAARSHYRVNTPDWILYPGAPGSPPYDGSLPKKEAGMKMWLRPDIWRQISNVGASSTGDANYPDAILSVSSLADYFDGIFSGDVGTSFDSESSSFYNWSETMDSLIVESTVPLLYTQDPNDFYIDINPVLDVLYRRFVYDQGPNGTLNKGNFFIRFGYPAHGVFIVPGELGKYKLLERVFFRKHLLNIDYPPWFATYSLEKNTILAKVKPNVVFPNDLSSAPFGSLKLDPGWKWKYIGLEPESIQADQRILFTSSGITTGESTSSVYFCSGTSRLATAFPASGGETDYFINHSVSSGFDVSAYYDIAKNANTPDLNNPGFVTYNFGPTQLTASGLIASTSAEYESGTLAGSSILCGPVEVLLHASGNAPFMLGVSLWDKYTTLLGDERSIFITNGYITQPIPEKAKELNSYLFHMGVEFYPLLANHRLSVIVEAYPWFRQTMGPADLVKEGVFRPGMYLHNFDVVIKEHPDSSDIVNTIDQRAETLFLNRGALTTTQNHDWMRITIPILPITKALILKDDQGGFLGTGEGGSGGFLNSGLGEDPVI